MLVAACVEFLYSFLWQRVICSIFSFGRLSTFLALVLAPLSILSSIATLCFPLAEMQYSLGAYLSSWGMMAVGGFWAYPSELTCSSLTYLLYGIQWSSLSSMIVALAHIVVKVWFGGNYKDLFLSVKRISRMILSFTTFSDAKIIADGKGGAVGSADSIPAAAAQSPRLRASNVTHTIPTFGQLLTCLGIDLVLMVQLGMTTAFLVQFYRSGMCERTFVPMRDTFAVGTGLVAVVTSWAISLASVLTRTFALLVWVTPSPSSR